MPQHLKKAVIKTLSDLTSGSNLYFLLFHYLLRIFCKSREIQCRKEVAKGFISADLLDAAIFMDEDLLMPEASIVVIAHAVTMSAGIVDNDEVAHFDFRKRSLDGEFIAILTKGAGHVIDVVLRCICFAEDSNVVVGTIHPRTHEVGHAGIGTDVVSVDVLVMDGFRDEEAIRASHHAAAFEGDAGIFKACHFFFEELLRTFAEAFEVDWILFRTIGDADAAAEVDEGDGDPFFSLNLIRKVKHHADGAEKPRELELRGDDHSMDTNVGDSMGLRPVDTGHELVLGHAILSFFRSTDDRIAACKLRPWIIAEADLFRDDVKTFHVA